MAETKTFSMAEVAAHAEKDNIYLVVHDKVYDCSKFVEEHPYVIYHRDHCPARVKSTIGPFLADQTKNRGGEEVMLDVGGQDATEAFEDVGHSDEARALLKDMLVGDLKREVSTNTSIITTSTTTRRRENQEKLTLRKNHNSQASCPRSHTHKHTGPAAPTAGHRAA